MKPRIEWARLLVFVVFVALLALLGGMVYALIAEVGR